MKPISTIISILLTVVVLSGCGSSSSSSSSSSYSGALADHIVGTWTGTVANVYTGMQHDNYEIIVTKVNDTTIEIAPASGSDSQTFQASLSLEMNGSVEFIQLDVAGNLLENNGEYVILPEGSSTPAEDELLSYGVFLGGDQSNLELFIGRR